MLQGKRLTFQSDRHPLDRSFDLAILAATTIGNTTHVALTICNMIGVALGRFGTGRALQTLIATHIAKFAAGTTSLMLQRNIANIATVATCPKL